MLSGWTWGTDSCWKCKSVSGVALTRLALRPATLWKLIRLIGLLITLLMMRSYMHLSDDGDDNAYCWSRLIWLSVLLISSICILVTQVDTNLIIGLIGGLVSLTFLIIWRRRRRWTARCCSPIRQETPKSCKRRKRLDENERKTKVLIKNKEIQEEGEERSGASSSPSEGEEGEGERGTPASRQSKEGWSCSSWGKAWKAGSQILVISHFYWSDLCTALILIFQISILIKPSTT